MSADGAAGRGPEQPPGTAGAAPDQAEIYLLVLQFLADGPCAGAVAALEQEATSAGLLPRRYDAFGVTHRLSREELAQRYPHVGPQHLPRLLQRLLTAAAPALPVGLSTLLGEGALSLLATPLTAPHVPVPVVPTPRSVGDTLAPTLAPTPRWVQPPTHPIPRWLTWPPPTLSSSAAHPVELWDAPPNVALTLRLREAGPAVACRGGRPGASGAAACGALCTPSLHASRLSPLRSIRGHRDVVYCAAFDHSGDRVVTGSDDCLVKVWAAHTGVLLRTCRGHMSEITDLVISRDDALLASASDSDGAIRTWGLRGGRWPAGHPVAVLIGHRGSVASLSFVPRLASPVLLSCGFDGTCRLWNATATGQALFVLAASPGAAPVPLTPPTIAGQGGGAHAAAPAGMDGVGHVPPAPPPPPHGRVPQLLSQAMSPRGDFFAAGGDDAQLRVWRLDALETRGIAVSQCTPAPREHQHRNDVHHVEFSHTGDALATGSADGTVRVWALVTGLPPGPGRGRGVGASAAAPPPGQAPWVCEWRQTLEGPAVATAPAPARIGRRRATPLAAVLIVRWAAGDCRLVAAVSDSAADRSLRVWRQPPGGGRWRLEHALSGHGDNAHVLECHPVDGRLAMSAAYDATVRLWDIERGRCLRVFRHPATPLTFPAWSAVAQAVAAAAPGATPPPMKLVDGTWSPDGAYFIVSDAGGHWTIFGAGGGASHSRAKYEQFFASDYDAIVVDATGDAIDAATGRLSHLPPEGHPGEQLCDMMLNPYDEAYQAAHLMGRLPAPVQAGGALMNGMPGDDDLWHAVAAVAPQPQPWDGGGHGPVAHGRPRGHGRAPRVITRPAGAGGSPSDGESDGGDDGDYVAPASSTEGEEGGGAARGGDGDVAFEPDWESDGDAGGHDLRSRGGLRRPVRRPPVTGRKRYATRGSQPEGGQGDGTPRGVDTCDDDDDSGGSGGVGGGSSGSRYRASHKRKRPPAKATRAPRPPRPRTRSRREEDDDDNDDDDDDDDSGDTDSGGGDTGDDDDAAIEASPPPPRATRTHRARGQHAGSRGPGAYAWLSGTHPPEGCKCVPQVGDRLVYLPAGHEAYFESKKDKATPRPAASFGHGLSPAEAVVVTRLEYAIAADEASGTVAVLTLQLCDEASPLRGLSFQVTLDDGDYPDYVVEAGRFEYSRQTALTAGDACLSYWGDASGWARGLIVAAPPPGAPPQWEGYSVAYEVEGVDQATETQSAWELFPPTSTPASRAAEAPCMDVTTRAALLTAVEAAIADETYAPFVAMPSANARYGGAEPYDRIVPLPFSLSLLASRLRGGYHRSVEAARHDATLLAANAARFNARGSPIVATAASLSSTLLVATGMDATDAQAAVEDALGPEAVAGMAEARIAAEAAAAARVDDDGGGGGGGGGDPTGGGSNREVKGGRSDDRGRSRRRRGAAVDDSPPPTRRWPPPAAVALASYGAPVRRSERPRRETRVYGLGDDGGDDNGPVMDHDDNDVGRGRDGVRRSARHAGRPGRVYALDGDDDDDDDHDNDRAVGVGMDGGRGEGTGEEGMGDIPVPREEEGAGADTMGLDTTLGDGGGDANAGAPPPPARNRRRDRERERRYKEKERRARDRDRRRTARQDGDGAGVVGDANGVAAPVVAPDTTMAAVGDGAAAADSHDGRRPVRIPALRIRLVNVPTAGVMAGAGAGDPSTLEAGASAAVPAPVQHTPPNGRLRLRIGHKAAS